MQAHRVARHVREDLLRYGLEATLQDIGHRAVNLLVDFQILKGMTAQLRDVNDPGFFEAPGFHGRFVRVEELVRTYEGTHELWPDFLYEAGLRGDRCYALFQGKTLASYGWYSHNPTPVDEKLRAPLRPFLRLHV
jgi:hypothetical protein